jgi:hypothetical protein
MKRYVFGNRNVELSWVVIVPLLIASTMVLKNALLKVRS